MRIPVVIDWDGPTEGAGRAAREAEYLRCVAPANWGAGTPELADVLRSEELCRDPLFLQELFDVGPI
jgi:hypothetical protein